MKEKILELHQAGKSYNEICKILGCSKSTVSYHCGEGQKNKNKLRGQKNSLCKTVSNKVHKFKSKNEHKVRIFQYKAKSGRKRSKENIVENFHFQDVLDKFGDKTNCYLTGREINLHEPKTYQFDHIVPPTKGGENVLSNLGITCKDANLAKHVMLHEDFLSLCKEVLEHHGYVVKKLKV